MISNIKGTAFFTIKEVIEKKRKKSFKWKSLGSIKIQGF